MKHGLPFHDRRTFLKSLSVLAAGAVLAPTVRVLPALASSPLRRAEEQRMLMGTIVGITVLADSTLRAGEAIGRAYADVERLSAIMSRFDARSALFTLNDVGRLDGAPQELLEVVRHGQALHQQSRGRFDMTIAPVVNLLARAHGKPDQAELREALSLVNASKLRLNGADLRFDSTGMVATLDGVAKGYIADRAAETLRREGVEHFMVDAGGDIRVQGSSNGLERPWHVAIEDPDKQGAYPSVLRMHGGAVATSGGYEVFFDPKRTSHHLVDPATGASPQYVKSVSVQAPTVMEADGLATALSLMHPREALNLTASLPGHACLLVTSSGARLASSNWGAVL